MIDEVRAKIAADKLIAAEAEYLLAHGWEQHVAVYRTKSGVLEDRWSLPRPDFVISNKYREITQGHAINVQKALSNMPEYWNRLRTNIES